MQVTTNFSTYAFTNATRRGATQAVFLRDISAAALILLSLVPEISTRYVFVPTIISWLLFAFLSSAKAFNKSFIKPDIKSYSVYLWLLTYIVFYLTGYVHGTGIERIFNLSRIGFTILFFNYYLEAGNPKTLKRLAFFSLCCIVFGSITTIRGLVLHPMAARVLATGMEELIQDYVGLYIGSFGFIYGLVFVTVAIFGMIRTNLLTKNKFLFLSIIALTIYTIYKAGFMMAILLLAVSIILLFLKIKKIRSLIITGGATFVLLLLFSSYLANFLTFLGNIVENEILSQRFFEFAYGLRRGSVEGTVNFQGRLFLVTLSIDTFLANPLFGIGGFYGYDTALNGIGGHSAVFDELAKYGVFGSGFLFIGMFSNVRFVFRSFADTKQRIVYFCTMFAFFFLAFINPFLSVPIFHMTFFVVPAIIWGFSKPIDNDKKGLK